MLWHDLSVHSGLGQGRLTTHCCRFAHDTRWTAVDPLRTFGLAYEIEMLLLHHRIQLLTWPRGMSGMPQFFGQTGAAASMRLSIN